MQTHTCLHASTCVHVCAHTHTHTHGILKVFPVTLSHAQPAFHLPTLKLVTITSCLVFIDDSFVTSLTIAQQAPLSLGFPRQEYWNELSSFSRISSHPRDWTHIFCVGRQILYHEPPGKLLSCISVQFSHSFVSNSLQPHGLEYARLSCP